MHNHVPFEDLLLCAIIWYGVGRSRVCGSKYSTCTMDIINLKFFVVAWFIHIGY